MGNQAFTEARRKAFKLLSFKPNNRVLMVGIGTGADLPFIPNDVNVIGVDISDAMLNIAKEKLNGRPIGLSKMNAEQLKFANETFDFVILNLVLSVVESPQKAMAEAARVINNKGKILVFDKFLSQAKQPSILRRILNLLTSMIGTDINRRFQDIMSGLPLLIEYDEPTLFGGSYRIILLKKN